ncbi:MAG: DUF6515 family protein [Rikenellaceae bacterium]
MKNLRTNVVLMLLAVMFTVNGAYAAPKGSDSKGSSSKSVSQKQSSSKKSPSKPVVYKSNSKVSYSKSEPAVSSLRSMPQGYKTYKRNGVNYHFHNGFYYRHIDGRYIRSVPPRGLRISVLPSLATRMFFNGMYYHYLNGVYYSEVKGGEYEVVDSPCDIIVDYLPEEAEEVYINDKRYFVYDQTLYTVITTPTGKSFKVAAQLEE